MTEKESQKIEQIITKAFEKVMAAGKRRGKEPYRQTEKLLRAYPVLKDNLERYQRDIEDIKHEDMGKSASIVLFAKNSGKTPKQDLEELRAEKIFRITEKLNRDKKMVTEIETALAYVKDKPYYRVIELFYFEDAPACKIEQELNCDRSTAWRNRKVLVNRICEVLYGADAL